MRKVIEAVLLITIAGFLMAFLSLANKEAASFFLDFLKVIFSWPFVLFFFLVFFQNELREFLKRVNKVILPGGGAVESSSDKILLDAQEKQEKEKTIIASEDGKDPVSSLDLDQTSFDEREIEIIELKKAVEFEKIHSSIFGSQIFLLKRLMGKTTDGENKESIKFFYEELKKQWPALSKKPLDEYMEFLLSWGIVEFRYPKYFITQKGIDFLIYLEKENYKDSRPL